MEVGLALYWQLCPIVNDAGKEGRMTGTFYDRNDIQSYFLEAVPEYVCKIELRKLFWLHVSKDFSHY